MRFFTICAKNYLAYAITLGEELQEHHPESTFTIFLADKIVGFDRAEIPFEIVTLEEVGLIDELGMINRYNITELSTALKPFCFLSLFERSDEPVVYLDPDIFVISPMPELRAGFESSDAILTPHIVRPVERAGLRSETFLRYGIYNLGFLGLKPSLQTESFLIWWAERLEADCRIDVQAGLFVDQKWADFVPSFVEDTKILRHEGYNVAYWNLHNRRVTKQAGTYLSNGAPLRFVHFSAIPEDDEPAISKRYPVFTVQNTPVVGELLARYRRRLRESRSDFFGALTFSYFLQPGDIENLHYPELVAEGETVGILPRSPDTYVQTKTVRSEGDYQRHLQHKRTREVDRRSREESLLQSSGDSRVVLDGYDLFAQRFTSFSAPTLMPGATAVGNQYRWQDELSAVDGHRSKVRSFVHLFAQELQPASTKLIHVSESASEVAELIAGCGARVEGAGTSQRSKIGSDGAIDYVLDFDTIESEADIETMIAQSWEALRPGGHLWVRLEDQKLGWQLLDQLGNSAFQNAHALTFWSWHFGYLGPHQLIYSAHKPQDVPNS